MSNGFRFPFGRTGRAVMQVLRKDLAATVRTSCVSHGCQAKTVPQAGGPTFELNEARLVPEKHDLDGVPSFRQQIASPFAGSPSAAAEILADGAMPTAKPGGPRIRELCLP
jgi:hypothetical protein